MSSLLRSAFFLSIVLTAWTGMHAYVAWRAWPLLPGPTGRRVLLVAFAVLWALYPLGRILAHQGLARTGDRFQGRGIGTELLNHLLDVARGEKLERVTATMTVDNHPMQQTCKKLGFRLFHAEQGAMVNAVIEL